MCLVATSNADELTAQQLPNILWITAEDMSPTMGCYGDRFATTPHLDRLATESSQYTHAFATSPVCSPSRACLINGLIAPAQGTHPMRSLFPLPKPMKGFPAWLRQRGYYTSNNVKTDYNSAAEPDIIEASWDENSHIADWRGRRPDQPFFSVINLMTTHQSRTMVWPYEQFVEEIQRKLDPNQIHDPDQVPLPPYYPDTPLVRKTQARYYDCVARMDQQVGEILKRLEEDGLSENTIVFFFSDHGSGMPRHKRALFDSGMKVPLLVRIPKQYGQLRPSQPGRKVNRLVCFEDFGPTVLSLAEIDSLPDYMQGQPFLGPLETKPRTMVFGHRDRVDEIWDMARSVRTRRYLYIRNFMPHLGYNQQSAWIDQGEIRKAFYQLAESGAATAAQRQYLAQQRPVEELYDCQADPLNLNNLADHPDHQRALKRLRRQVRKKMVASKDLGLVPESELWKRSEGSTPYRFAGSDRFDVTTLQTAAYLVGSQKNRAIFAALESPNPSVRYWAAVSCRSLKKLPAKIQNKLEAMLEDPAEAVAIEAAAVLAESDLRPEALDSLVERLEHDEPTVILHAARTLELIGDPKTFDAIESLAARFADEPGDMAWFIRFTTSGYLSRIEVRE